MARALTFLVFILLLASCKDNKTMPESQMYEASELAQLMRNMHDTLELWKQDLSYGTLPPNFSMPQEMLEMHTANATNPKEINDAFHLMADNYLAQMEKLTTKEHDDVVQQYNTVINSCVTCHQSFCTGPIPKIEKLLIP